MGQSRLYFRASGARARQIFAAIERAFEDDGYPFAILELDEAEDLHEISLYTHSPADDELRLLALIPSGEDIAIRCEIIPDIDWVAKSLEGLPPVRADRFLVHGAHDRAARRPGDIAIEIEAGQAFGTGHHATTAGCLAMIGEVVRCRRPARALDLGTGSAVLAIALAKLARIKVLASDIDPVAAGIAARNVRSNGEASRVTIITARGFAHPAMTAAAPFDLIVANILASPLMTMAPAMARHLAPGGSLILSGILARQRRAVIAAYVGQGFRLVRSRAIGEWVSMQLTR